MAAGANEIGIRIFFEGSTVGAKGEQYGTIRFATNERSGQTISIGRGRNDKRQMEFCVRGQEARVKDLTFSVEEINTLKIVQAVAESSIMQFEDRTPVGVEYKPGRVYQIILCARGLDDGASPVRVECEELEAFESKEKEEGQALQMEFPEDNYEPMRSTVGIQTEGGLVEDEDEIHRLKEEIVQLREWEPLGLLRAIEREILLLQRLEGADPQAIEKRHLCLMADKERLQSHPVIAVVIKHISELEEKLAALLSGDAAPMPELAVGQQMREMSEREGFDSTVAVFGATRQEILSKTDPMYVGDVADAIDAIEEAKGDVEKGLNKMVRFLTPEEMEQLALNNEVEYDHETIQETIPERTAQSTVLSTASETSGTVLNFFSTLFGGFFNNNRAS